MTAAEIDAIARDTSIIGGTVDSPKSVVSEPDRRTAKIAFQDVKIAKGNKSFFI